MLILCCDFGFPDKLALPVTGARIIGVTDNNVNRCKLDFAKSGASARA